MRKALDTDSIKRLETLCGRNGFPKRGNAYFRILDCNVLQVLKFEYERCMEHYDLRLGLFSMFSPLAKQWFTSVGCIPRYSIVNLKGLRSPVILKETGGFVEFEIVSEMQQVKMLEERGICLLDGIRTQQGLIEALDEIETGTAGRIQWCDSLRIAPYLMTHRADLADKVIASILQQNLDSKAWTQEPWEEYDFAKCREMGFDTVCVPGESVPLMQIHLWIKEQRQEEIDRYLQKNFSDNTRFGKFLL